MRIGGDFEIDVTTLLTAYGVESETSPSLPQLWLDTGRSGIAVSLEHIISKGGAKRAILPAYICPSVVAVFKKYGFSIRYLSAHALEQPPHPADGETILFAHYFGMRDSAVVEWIENLRNRSAIFVIEDCVQASLSTNVGTTGDYVISSFRKFMQQPDGALLRSREAIAPARLAEPDEAFVSSKFLAKLLRNAECRESQFLQLLDEAEEWLETSPPRKMSWLSTYLMNCTDIHEIQKKRRANWQALFNQFDQAGMLEYVAPLFSELSEGDVPLGFAVRVRRGHRNGLRRQLAESSIYCPVHWGLTHLAGRESEFPIEWELSQNILTFPIDQRMDGKHIEYLANHIARYFE